jgi:hypothetical protein
MITITRAGMALAAILTVAAHACRAQDINLARLEAGRARLTTSFGLDPALLTTVGYSRGFGLGERTAAWDADLGMVVAAADAQDLRARLGLLATVWQAGAWRVASHGRLIARTTSNVVYDGAAFGADLTVSAGHYRRRWFAAGLVGYDRTIVMHIEHSRWYRENVYDRAVDGWYRGESGILHGGATVGVAVGAVEIAARLEWRRLDKGSALDPPFVGGLSLSHPL